MDALTFIAEVVKATAWPLTVGIMLFFLRKEIAYILRYLQKLKYKDFELEFSRQMDKIRKSEVAAKPKPNNIVDEKKNRIHSFIDISPRIAILEAWLEVEKAAVEHTTGLKALYEGVQLSPSQLARYLVRSEILDPEKAKIYNKLLALRNMAVHSTDDVVLPRHEVIEYIELAFSLAGYLNEKNITNKPTQ